MKEKYLYICPKCQSTNVEVGAWIRPNKGDKFKDVDTCCEDDALYCQDCEEHSHVDFETLVPVDIDNLRVKTLVWRDCPLNPERNGAYIVLTKHPDREQVQIYHSYKGGHQFVSHKELYIMPQSLVTHSWTCTDTDNQQYCKKLTDSCFIYKEWDRFTYGEGCDFNDCDKVDRFYDPEYWIEIMVNMDDYSHGEITNHISPYANSIEEVKEIYGDNWKQIVCECIFEQESGLY